VRKVFAGLATLLMLVVVVQFFLAASSAFDTAPKDESFSAHRALGYGIVLFAVVLAVVGAAARVPGRLLGMTGLIAALGIGQGLIAAVAGALGDTADTSTTAGRMVFGLHAVNALIIFGVAETVARRARTLARTPAAVAAAAGGQAP
jgi:hypothetical protein